ncbi:MAG: DNA-3-methyladenine glycosylase family protein [Candidatus Limnocylindrales bacterium]
MAARSITLTGPLDLVRTLAPLRHGPYDPTIKLASIDVWRGSRTPEGSATLRLRLAGPTVEAEAWGPGAAWELDHLPELLGETDRPSALTPHHPLLAELVRHFPGVRLTRTDRVVEALVPGVIEQKITGLEAGRIYRRLIRMYGDPAPGPGASAGLMVPPEPRRLATLPYHAYHPLGLEQRRADVLRRIGVLAARLEASLAEGPQQARARLQAVAGIGPWTAAEATRIALGDPDAVSVGDFHLPSLVAFSLAGETEADDERMLELLEPYRGQRARVVRLLELGGRSPARRAPRMAARTIERL